MAKSKSTATNLSSHVPTSSSSAMSPIASKSPGILTATGKPESRMRRNSKSDAVSSSQARLQDACLGGLMDTATGKQSLQKRNQLMWTFFESETGSDEECDRETGLLMKQLRRNPMHPVIQTAREVQKLKGQNGPHSLRVSPAATHHAEAVFSTVSGIYGREHDDPMDDLDVNMAM